MTQARLLLVVLLSSLLVSTSGFSSGSLFDEYRAGDFARFDSDLKDVRDFKPLLDEATASSSSWPADVGSAYLLEVSAAAFRVELFPALIGSETVVRRPSFSGGPLLTPLKMDWRALFGMAEQTAMRTPPTSAVARAWGRAAVALLEGANEVPPQTGAGLGDAGEQLRLLLKSMGNRLDDETVLMAKGNIYEAKVATIISYDLPTISAHTGSTRDSASIPKTDPVIRATLDLAFDEGTKIFTAGETYPDVRAESAVRWAGLAVLRGRPGDVLAALSHLKLARLWKPAPDVLYASWILEGQARQLVGDAPAATAAFRQAAELAPDGSTAALGLAVQRFLAGDSAEADQLAQRILDAPAGTVDPWILFQRSDYRNWAHRIDDLRKAIR